MKTVWRLCLLLTAVLLATPVGYERPAQATSQEYQVKAAFLLNFAKFVDWPPSAFADAHAPLVLGVIGEDPFGSVLDSLNGQVVKDRTLTVKRFSTPNELHQCHILFISPSVISQLGATISTMENKPILTVSDGIEQFSQQGIVVNFLFVDNKIRFEVNLDVVKRTGLSMSSQLLQLAKVVGNGQ